MKFIVKIVSKMGKAQNVIYIKEIVRNEVVRFEKNTYPINYSMPSVITKEGYVYYLQEGTGAQLSLDGEVLTITPAELDEYLQDHVIRDLATSKEADPLKWHLISLIIGAIMGLLAGIFIAMEWL